MSRYQLNVQRHFRIPIVLATLVFYSAPGWANAWQQNGSARISTEYDSNPAMVTAYRVGVWRSLFEPSYNIKRTSDANEMSAGLALKIARSSNKVVSQNRDDPSVFINGQMQSGIGDFAMSARYDEADTRINEIDITGPVLVNGTRVSSAISANWSDALSEHSTLSMDGAYQDISYRGATLVGFVTRTAGMMFRHALNERSASFVKVSYAHYEPTNVNAASQLSSAVVGWDWKALDNLDINLQAGKTKLTGASMGKQGAATVNYTGQRTSLVLNADRQITASGLGGFVTVDHVSGSWSYAWSEFSKAGIDQAWRENRSITNVVNRTTSAWLQHELSSDWLTRTYYHHSISESPGIGKAYSDILGISLIYTRNDF